LIIFCANSIGLDSWSPNINIARDPRWGRSCEVASEDPLINGDFGSQYTQGVQMPVRATHPLDPNSDPPLTSCPRLAALSTRGWMPRASQS